MVTIAQRIEALRTQKGLSRPALSAALGLPRMAVEKFETGRQTPTQDQQQKLAAYFGVSLAYLKGETDDPTTMDSWLNGAGPDDDPPPPPRPATRPVVVQSSGGSEDGAVFSALLKSKSFQTMVRDTVLEVLRSKEGQELLAKAIHKELNRRYTKRTTRSVAGGSSYYPIQASRFLPFSLLNMWTTLPPKVTLILAP